MSFLCAERDSAAGPPTGSMIAMLTRLGATPRWPCPKCALPNARAVELASQTDGVSTFKCATCGTSTLALNAAHCSEDDADTSSETRWAAHDRCGVPFTLGILLATLSVEIHMNKLVLSLPTLGFVVGTRAALGVGIGLLL